MVLAVDAGFEFLESPPRLSCLSKILQLGYHTLFFQSLGGSEFVSVGNSILNDRLVHYIAALNLPAVTDEHTIQAGATAWQKLVSWNISAKLDANITTLSGRRSKSG